jgi:hypothetical protein
MDSAYKICRYYVIIGFQVLTLELDYLIVLLWVETQNKTIK